MYCVCVRMVWSRCEKESRGIRQRERERERAVGVATSMVVYDDSMLFFVIIGTP